MVISCKSEYTSKPEQPDDPVIPAGCDIHDRINSVERGVDAIPYRLYGLVKQKGWFDIIYLAMDERSTEQIAPANRLWKNKKGHYYG